jgi:hypothetical protein
MTFGNVETPNRPDQEIVRQGQSTLDDSPNPDVTWGEDGIDALLWPKPYVPPVVGGRIILTPTPTGAGGTP